MDIFIPIREEFQAKLAENNIIKKSVVAIPAVTMASGMILFFLPLSGILPAAFIQPTAATLLLVAGVILWIKTPKYRYRETGKPVAAKRIYFDTLDKERVVACLSGNVANGSNISRRNNTGGIIMNVYVEKGGNFLAAQLSQYVPYEYQLITGVYFFHGEQARQISKALL
ncbi:MAG: hypothetical protein LBT48_00830 [Prevotellaceae bacterium]|jgi:hypothetical protein|nr:hypothetical protein [Prevotellaceae bacterium]